MSLHLALTKSHQIFRFLVLVPVILSAFTHLWNPAGFPDLFFDEGIYMRRAMFVIEHGSPQEAFFHDHPFFGQLFLAGALAVSGFPNSLNSAADAQSMEALYAVPRVLMGLLAVADTFLIYKISQQRYNSRVALIASTLFAVMPITWLVRRILLDSILLPFLLSSILFALYSRNSGSANRRYLLVALSGAFLGLAIFTKMPAVTMIPLVGFLVYSNGGARLKNLGLWFVPLVLIPLIWPLQSVAAGQFDAWVKDVLWQTGRDSDRIAQVLRPFFVFDPVLLVLGFLGAGYAAFRRDVFALLWLFPFLIFLSLIGYAQYFHVIPILPVICIVSAVLIDGLADRAKNAFTGRIARMAAVSAITAFGLVSTTMLITTNMTSAQFEAAAFALASTGEDTTIISNPIYSWMYIYVFGVDHVFRDYLDVIYYPIETKKVILISDNHFENDISMDAKLAELYEKTSPIETFEGQVLNYDLGKYPYTSMDKNYEGSKVEVRTN